MNARQSRFQTNADGDIELDLEGVTVPSCVPKPPVPQPVVLPLQFQKLVDREDARPPSTDPPLRKKPRVLPFIHHSGPNAPRMLMSTMAKSRHSNDIKQITEMRRWAKRVARRRKAEEGEEEEEEAEETEEPCKRPREEEVRKPRQSTSDLLMELEKEHSQRMREQAEADTARRTVRPT